MHGKQRCEHVHIGVVEVPVTISRSKAVVSERDDHASESTIRQNKSLYNVQEYEILSNYSSGARIDAKNLAVGLLVLSQSK